MEEHIEKIAVDTTNGLYRLHITFDPVNGGNWRLQEVEHLQVPGAVHSVEDLILSLGFDLFDARLQADTKSRSIEHHAQMLREATTRYEEVEKKLADAVPKAVFDEMVDLFRCKIQMLQPPLTSPQFRN